MEEEIKGSVSSVDLDELKRAREELNRERGIEPQIEPVYNSVETPQTVEETATNEAFSPEAPSNNEAVSTDMSLDDLLDSLLGNELLDEKINEYAQNKTENAENAGQVVSPSQASSQDETEQTSNLVSDSVYDSLSEFEVSDNAVSAPKTSADVKDSEMDDLLNMLEDLSNEFEQNQESSDLNKNNTSEQIIENKNSENQKESIPVVENSVISLADIPDEIQNNASEILENEKLNTTELLDNIAKSDELSHEKLSAETQILEQELKNLNEDQEEKSDEQIEENASKYKLIPSYKFTNVISSDDFKNSNNLSYVLGKDENENIVYGNLIDSYNVALFAKNSDYSEMMVNSVLLSLMLKNSVKDISFMICDANSDSNFEIYNKSSYMYFNRIAKTNKEILDSLIELSKELEERYKIFAETGVKSIEQYNIIAKNDDLKQLPYILTIFNNYSKSAQLTNADKINTCLHQLLKSGSIVGLYVVVVADSPIIADEINYNLPTRIAFKMDDESSSLTTIGYDGAENLDKDGDFLLFTLIGEGLKHLKSALLTIPETNIMIETIEE